MSKATHTLLVAAVTAAVILTSQTVWHHFHPPIAQGRERRARLPLNPQEAAEAKQAATDFFEAMSNGDWTTVANYWPADAPKKMDDIFTPKIKQFVTGLQIVSLGTPYKEGGTSIILVPYEIQWESGGSHINNLGLKKGEDGQWIWTGGF